VTPAANSSAASAAAFATAALLCAAAAGAHTLSESHSSWQISGDTIHLQMIVPELEAKRLSKSGKDLPSSAELGRYLAARMGASAGKRECARVEGPRSLQSTPGFFREEIVFKCPGTQDLKIHSSAFYDLVASHTNFARIEDSEGRFFEQLLTQDHREIEVSGGDSESTLQNAGLLTFIGMGVMHIFTGIDHMSFMLGLVLISRRVRDLLFVVTGFTIGHSLTLALAVTGVLRPDAQYIDALVALTIALIGAENIGDSTHHPLPVALGLGGILFCMALAKYLGLGVSLPMVMLIGGGIFAASYLMLTGHMRDAGRVRLLVTLVFGLIHGFGFAANLLEMHLPTDRLAELLVGFNIGVEIGQVTVVMGAVLIAWSLVRLRLALPRPLFTDIAASFLVGEGLYWFLGRTVALT
jgi:HupE / UreJ protein